MQEALSTTTAHPCELRHSSSIVVSQNRIQSACKPPTNRFVKVYQSSRAGFVATIAAVLTAQQKMELATLQSMYSDQDEPIAQSNANKRITVIEVGRDQLKTEMMGSANTEIDVEWHLTRVKVLQQPKRLFWHAADRIITAVAVSPSGKLIATGTGRFPDDSNPGKNGEIRIWDISNGALLQEKFLNSEVGHLGFRDNDTLLVTAKPKLWR